MKIILFTFLAVSSSFFCDCKTIGYTNEGNRNELILKHNFENSEVIFYGKNIGNKNFKILELHRGKKLLGLKVISEKEELTTCDDYFEKDRHYLIFGRLNENGKLVTSTCKANRQISKEDQQKLINKYL